jgi:hypothetical protein
MRDLKKKKSCEPGFCHNIPVGGAAGRVMLRDLKKKKNCEPGFYTRLRFHLLSIPLREEQIGVALVNEVKTRISLLSQNILGSMWNLPPAGREVLGKEAKVCTWVLYQILPRGSHTLKPEALGLASSWGRGCTRHAAPSMSRPPFR